tara:strand:- start:221 stop:688 length:468 start_codon:yes stop_codon:yes gene_type:complete
MKIEYCGISILNTQNPCRILCWKFHGRHSQFSSSDRRIIHRIPLDDLGVQNDERGMDTTKEVDLMEAQPAYTRSWKEIEMMLDEAREQMYEQKSKFNHRKKIGDKAGCRRAAAKFARAKGMVDMLIWVIGGRGVQDPMAGFEDVSENPSLRGFSS